MTGSKKSALLAYVPVLHRGYLDFFSAHDGDIWIFGPDLIKSYVHLTRDVRALEPEQMVSALTVIFPKRHIHIADAQSIKNWKYASTHMPDDEVCHDLAKKYLKGKRIQWSSVFLRWNRIITFKELEISPDRKITRATFHKELIKRAFAETGKSSDWWRQVAALAVKGSKVVLSAYNHHLPTDHHLTANGDPRSNFDAGQHMDIFTSIHAEAEVIAKAAAQGISLKGSSFYVTTFPCPNCARLIGTAGVKKVYYSKGYSLLDAEKILDHFGVEVILVQ